MKTTEKLEKHSIGLEDCLYQEENHYFKKASIGVEDCPYQEENYTYPSHTPHGPLTFIYYSCFLLPNVAVKPLA